jgi:hypothetical protein
LSSKRHLDARRRPVSAGRELGQTTRPETLREARDFEARGTHSVAMIGRFRRKKKYF